MDRYLVTGAAGMLGCAVVAAGPPGTVGTTRDEADLANRDHVQDLFSRGYAGVIHCAGYTDVDGAEAHPDDAERGNVTVTRLVAEACARSGTPLVVVGSDYVFDGTAERPYRESDAPHPLGVYARSKRGAEEQALALHPSGTRVIRSAWLYGAGGRNFPDTMLALARSGKPLRVVADQIGSPTSTRELAPVLWDALAGAPPGIYHAACEGSASWHAFACAAFEIVGIDADIEPCTTREFPRPAPRPPYSVLDSSKLAAARGKRLLHWRDALSRYLSK